MASHARPAVRSAKRARRGVNAAEKSRKLASRPQRETTVRRHMVRLRAEDGFTQIDRCRPETKVINAVLLRAYICLSTCGDRRIAVLWVCCDVSGRAMGLQ